MKPFLTAVAILFACVLLFFALVRDAQHEYRITEIENQLPSRAYGDKCCPGCPCCPDMRPKPPIIKPRPRDPRRPDGKLGDLPPE